jgi:hypothetical protein
MTDKRLKYLDVPTILEQAEAFVDPVTNAVKLRLSRLLPTCLRDFNYHVTVKYNTVELALEANSTLPMPTDTVTPHKVFLKKNCGNYRVLYQFGRRERGSNSTFLQCDVPAENEVSNCTSEIQLPDAYGQTFGLFYNYNLWYGESYGQSKTRFFGHWEYNANQNRVEVTNGQIGDRFIVVYESQGDDYSSVPEYAVNALIYRMLLNYYRASDLNKSREYERAFRQEMVMVKKFVHRGYAYEDYLDAITGEYTSTVR